MPDRAITLAMKKIILLGIKVGLLVLELKFAYQAKEFLNATLGDGFLSRYIRILANYAHKLIMLSA